MLNPKATRRGRPTPRRRRTKRPVGSNVGFPAPARALARARDHYADLWEHAPAACLQMDAAGRVVEVNLAAAALLGHNRVAVRGCPLADLLAEPDRPAWEAHRRALAESPQGAELLVTLAEPSGEAAVILRVRSVPDTLLGRAGGGVRCTLDQVPPPPVPAADEPERAIWGALNSPLAVLDAAGVIVRVNPAWEREARENGAATAVVRGVGLDYLAACTGSGEAARARAGIAAVLAGRAADFRQEYGCPSLRVPGRWFQMVVTPPSGGRGAVVVHHEITERRRAEQALREQSAWLRAILDTAAEGILAVDGQGRVESCNAAAEGLFGWSSGALVGRPLADLIPAAATGESGRVAGFGLRSNGTRLPLEVTLREVAWGGRKVFAALVRDTTERLAAEKALREREEQLLSFVQQAPVALAMFDRGMNYLATSWLWLQTFAPDFQDLTGHNHYLIHPDLPERWRQVHHRALGGEASASDEDLWVKADGTQVWLRWAVHPWVDAQGVVGGIMIMAVDITKLKGTEEELIRKEALLARTQAVAQVGSFELQDQPLTWSGWSLETYRIHGLDPAESPPRLADYLDRWIHPADRAAANLGLAGMLRTGVGGAFEYRFRRPDGVWRHARAVAEALPPAAGGARVWAGSVQDITERKTLEHEILEISEREQNRIGQDLHGGLCRHLAAIEFRLRFLKQRLDEIPGTPATEAEALAGLLQQAISQTRSLARGLSPVMPEAEGLMNALQELAVATSDAFRVRCHLHCPVPVPIADNTMATHLYRIAQEAVHNALRHGHATEVEVQLFQADSGIVLAVRDNGQGFTPPPVEHPGMGLRVMRFRAGLVGGALLIEARPTGGTRVICTLAPGLDRAGALPAIPFG